MSSFKLRSDSATHSIFRHIEFLCVVLYHLLGSVKERTTHFIRQTFPPQGYAIKVRHIPPVSLNKNILYPISFLMGVILPKFGGQMIVKSLFRIGEFKP